MAVVAGAIANPLYRELYVRYANADVTPSWSYLGFWDMQSTNGAQTLDISGNDNHATILRETTWVSVYTNGSYTNKAFNMDGVDDRLWIDNISNYYYEATGSVMLWCNVDVDDGAYNAPLWGGRTGEGSSGALAIFMRLDSSDLLDMLCADSTGVGWRFNTATNSMDAFIGSWIHICLVQDGTEPVLYINGT